MPESIRELILPNSLIEIHGRMGEGKTLSAIAMIVLSKFENIVSNINLSGIKHEMFNISNLFEYKNSLILWDMAEFQINDRKLYDKIHDNLLGFLEGLKEENNHLILTIEDKYSLVPEVRDLVDMSIITHFDRLHDVVKLRAKSHSGVDYINLGGVSQYFKYYETREIPISISEVLNA